MRLGATFFILAGVGACAIHPLPKDLTRETTVDIVEHIMCESRDAVKTLLIEYLTEDKSNFPKSYRLGKRISTGRDTLRNLDLRGIEKQVRDTVSRYANSGLVLEFKFTITEDNDSTADLTLKDPFANGVFTLNIKGGKEKQRKNIRNFIYGSTFSDLHNTVDDKTCEKLYSPSENHLYPITGIVGMHEVMDTYLTLENRNLLKPRKKGEDPAFADTLTFETRLFGNVDPKVVLSPMTNNFHLAEAGGSLGAERKDIHEVTITLSTPETTPKINRFTTTNTSALDSAIRESQAQREFRFQDSVIDRQD